MWMTGGQARGAHHFPNGPTYSHRPPSTLSPVFLQERDLFSWVLVYLVGITHLQTPKCLGAHIPKYQSTKICLSCITSLMVLPIPTALVLQCPWPSCKRGLHPTSRYYTWIWTPRCFCLDEDITSLMAPVVLIAQLFSAHTVSTAPARV